MKYLIQTIIVLFVFLLQGCGRVNCIKLKVDGSIRCKCDFENEDKWIEFKNAIQKVPGAWEPVVFDDGFDPCRKVNENKESTTLQPSYQQANPTDNKLEEDTLFYFERNHFQTGTYLVASDKSYLHDEPDSATITKIYIINGDMVEAMDRDDDFIFIKYVSPRGKTFEGWVYDSTILRNK
jgi:hypothetical protein